MAYLELCDVDFSYSNGFEALHHVSMRFEMGEAVAIIGQNGAGKTTVVKLMNGLLKPSRGQVLVDGVTTKQQRTSQVAAKVGYVFQNPDDQIFQDTIGKEIAYGLVKKKVEKSAVKAKVAAAARLCGLEDEMETHPYDLPFSRRKFVTIASALVMDPKILILDEPTAGQDAPSTRLLADIIQGVMASGKTVITITHDMEFVTKEFSRGIVMAKKHVLMDAPIAEIFENDEVLEEAHLKRPYIAQLARSYGIRGVLTDEELLRAM